ncbi:hypothetical protein BDU57DRAFT_480830, partial [Ampelomyces quisqualis]
MRPLRLLLALSTSLAAATLVLYVALTSHQDKHLAPTSHTGRQGGFTALLSFASPGSLFPPSAIISLTDDNSTFFLARPAAFGPALAKDGLSSALWIGSGFGDDTLGKGELGCGDSPDWRGHDHGASHAPEPKPARIPPKGLNQRSAMSGPAASSLGGTANTHADIKFLQESAEISGKVVLLKRGACGFSAKVLWAQKRGAVAVIVGDNVRGGGLIRMYAQGDTSNVTIPSLFTSHTTAHLLSSLLPADTVVGPDVNFSKSGSNVLPGSGEYQHKTMTDSERKAWWARWFRSSRSRSITSITDGNSDDVDTSMENSLAHEGLWVTLTPTNVSASPFFDTLLVLV